MSGNNEDFLPIELEAESVYIRGFGDNWEVVVKTESYGDLVLYPNPPDPLYDQLHDQGVLAIEDGDVVSTTSND